MSVAILIPAAGASSRMRGQDKLMMQIDGKPLLRHVAERACAVSQRVIVTLPPNSDRREALTELDLTIVDVEAPQLGMSQSLKCGAAQVDPHEALMVLPADMPELMEADLMRVISAYERNPRIVRGSTGDGIAGHPVIFPPEYAQQFQSLTGDEGARPLIKGKAVDLIELPDNHALTDLDTREAWTAWIKKRQSYDPKT